MCDTIAGELLVSYHETDAAAAALIERLQSNNIPHISIIEELGNRVTRARLPMRRGICFKFYRLAVPPGEEVYRTGNLQFHYKHEVLDALNHKRLDPRKNYNVLSSPNYHLQVVPHSWLTTRQSSKSSAVGFSFTQTHNDYKKLIGWSAPTGYMSAKNVLILDTGLDPASTCPVIEQTNFVDDTRLNDVSDDHGHGTAVTEVIHDLCDYSELTVYKVADSNGRASEWDMLAALAAQNNSDIVNISLAFGLPNRTCTVCGRESHSSRSAVFENMVDQLCGIPDSPLIVAAAGNDSLNELSFPARFDNIIALESINQNKELSQFSNRATIDHTGKNHDNVFVLPGGEKSNSASPVEYIGTSAAGEEFYGTSFSTAYASGLLAALWSQAAHHTKDRQQLINHIRSKADYALPGYSSSTHGNGMMTFN